MPDTMNGQNINRNGTQDVIYSVFVSSVYKELVLQRNQVIEYVLNSGKLPICMEHFTANGLSYILRLIDRSDFVVLLLGKEYGSCDKDTGKSITQLEYEYAQQKKKHILTLACNGLGQCAAQCKNDPVVYETLSESHRKQVDFYNEISGFVREINETVLLQDVLVQYFANVDYHGLGWVKQSQTTAAQLQMWQEQHKAFHLDGTWYHAMTSDVDKKYIRIGTVKIAQQFEPESYTSLHFSATNYGVADVNFAEQAIIANKYQATTWHGDFTLKDDGNIMGIFNAHRNFEGDFNGELVGNGDRYGIIFLSVDNELNQEDMLLQGHFHDVTPSPKKGNIYLFRTEKNRFDYLLATRREILLQLHPEIADPLNE